MLGAEGKAPLLDSIDGILIEARIRRTHNLDALCSPGFVDDQLQHHLAFNPGVTRPIGVRRLNPIDEFRSQNVAADLVRRRILS